MIEIKNLDKTYHLKNADVHAIDNVSISVNDGDVYGIIGYSGAGKSSLVRCINLLEKPDSGEISIDGVKICENQTLDDGTVKSKCIKGKKLNQERRKIGMIFQHFNLLDRKTVYDNVAYPLKYSKESLHLGFKLTLIIAFSSILTFLILLFTLSTVRINVSNYSCPFKYFGDEDLNSLINESYTSKVKELNQERYKNINSKGVKLSYKDGYYYLSINLSNLGSKYFPNETNNEILAKAFMTDYVESLGVDDVAFKYNNKIITYENKINVAFYSSLALLAALIISSTLCILLLKPIPFYKAKKKEISEKVYELLKTVGLEEKANVYPSELSGGQKQRVAIARALANDPSVLLSDESTSALDPDATESILNLLSELNKKLGLTIVLITHEMSVIKSICNRVSVMEFGEVVEEGSVYDVFSYPKHDATKRFIDSTSTFGKIGKLVEENSPIVKTKEGESLIKLTYHKDSVGDAIISEVSRIYNVNISITLANVEYIEGLPLGNILVALSGDENNIKDAINYFKDHHVEVEVIKHA